MTAPDPTELTAPHDPAAYGRPVRLGPVFAAFIGFGVICVLAGVFFAFAVPKLFPTKPAHPAAVAQPASAAPAASIDARLADIQARLAAAPAAEAATGAASPQVSILVDRIERLETGQQRLFDAASGALAAASLSETASTSRPFAGELAALQAALPDSLDVAALRPLAETGAPTAAALAAEFPDVAARAAIASRARASGQGFFAQVAQALASIVTVRRVDKTEGTGADAVLARAQKRLDEGDLAGASAELAGLPGAGRDAVAAWRQRAAGRIEIDRHIQAIRAAALAGLAQASVRQRAAPAQASSPVNPPAMQGPAA
jgi:hypothetical protein